jgi:hypothetical protein
MQLFGLTKNKQLDCYSLCDNYAFAGHCTKYWINVTTGARFISVT